MTPLQQFGWLLLPVAAFQVWMMIYRPEQYERERQRRDNIMKGAANAGAPVVRYLINRYLMKR